MGTSRRLTRRQLWTRLLVYPGHTLPTAIAPVLVAVGLAVREGVFNPYPVLLAFIGSWLIHLGGVFADNYELLKRFPHLPEHPELLAALDNDLDLASLRRAVIGCFAVGVLSGAYLFYLGGPMVLPIGLAGVAASAGYASGGLRYTRFGLADPIFFLMFGVVAEVGAYYIQAASRIGGVWDGIAVGAALPRDVFLLGLPVGALVTNVLVIDDIRDRRFDAEKGWRTTAVRFGLVGSRIEYVALTVFAFLAPVYFWSGLGYSVGVLLPLLALPLAIHIGRAVLTQDTAEALFVMTPRAAMLSMTYSVLLSVGIAL
jgi:1,4-dihydroxy-2-naphthoate octaprenyltransferase